MVFLAAWLAVYFNVFFFLVSGNRNFESQGIILKDSPLITTMLIMAAAMALFYLLLNIYHSNI